MIALCMVNVLLPWMRSDLELSLNISYELKVAKETQLTCKSVYSMLVFSVHSDYLSICVKIYLPEPPNLLYYNNIVLLQLIYLPIL